MRFGAWILTAGLGDSQSNRDLQLRSHVATKETPTGGNKTRAESHPSNQDSEIMRIEKKCTRGHDTLFIPARQS
jgi:hypothetical protein